MSKCLPWLACAAFLLATWTLLSQIWGAFIIPTPASVWLTLTAQTGYHLGNLAVSGSLALGGLVVASLTATGFILLIAVIPSAQDYVYPFFVMIKSTPAVAIAPILMCCVGIGVWSKVLVAASIAFFPLVVGGIDALLWMPRNMTNLARCYGATHFRYVQNIGWGYILSGFMTGLKTAAPLSVVGALVGEFVTAGSPRGLGLFILSSVMNLQKPNVFAGAILSCVLGLISFGFASVLKDFTERRLHLGG